VPATGVELAGRRGRLAPPAAAGRAGAGGRRDQGAAVVARQRVELLESAYQAFNRRDFEAVLALVDPLVEWPNLIDGTTLRGRDQVRAYWRRQLETIESHVEPLGFDVRGDEVVVEVHQVVRGRDGGLLSDARVRHVYAFAGGPVRAMRVEAGRGWRVSGARTTPATTTWCAASDLP
jgi:ketosteroid isomerase-like protein